MVITRVVQATLGAYMSGRIQGSGDGSTVADGSLTAFLQGGGGLVLPYMDVDGVAFGTLLVPQAGVTLQLGHATDPGQAAGDYAPFEGYNPAGKKLKGLVLVNDDLVHKAVLSIPAANGLAGVGFAANAVFDELRAGGFLAKGWPDGSAALTAGTNDGLKILPTGLGALETQQIRIGCLYGP